MTNLPSSSKAPAEKWADIGDLRVRYLDWGGDGPPVVALHGLASSAHWYELVASRLAPRYHIVAPDQRGHGQTTQAASGYDWQTLADDVVGFMDHVGFDKAAVFGHSWGATVALSVAARFPERATALGLIDGGISRDSGSGETWEQVRPRIRPRDVSGTREQFLDRLRTQLAFCWNADIERIVQTMVYEDGEGQIQDILRPENHLQVMRAMWEEPTWEAYPKVLCPTLIAPAGPLPERADTERARSRQERVAAAAGAISDSRVRWIPETVHDIGYHKPAELAQVIDEFLRETGT